MTTELKPCPFCLVVPATSANAMRYDPKGSATRNGLLYQPQLGYMCVPCGVHRLVDVPLGNQFGERAYEIARLHWNTRTTPDVPELVRYSPEIERIVYVSGSLDAPAMRKDEKGYYVRHDQAAEVISNLKEDLELSRDTMRRYRKRAHAAEAKLALLKERSDKINDQKPAAYTLIFRKAYGVNAETTFKTFEDAEKYAVRCELPLSSVIPLYAAPVASEAETIERMWETLDAIRVEAYQREGVSINCNKEALKNTNLALVTRLASIERAAIRALSRKEPS